MVHPPEAASPPHCHSATHNLPSGVDSLSTPSDDATPAHPTQSCPVIFTIIEPVLTTGVSDISRAIIISLLVIANLIQFISNFLTLSGGLTLTHALGRETGPGKANWMAASYSWAPFSLFSILLVLAVQEGLMILALPNKVTQSTFVLISGRLGAIYGHQRLALIGLGIFAIFSLANGFCRSFESFVAVRALSGVGGGIYMPNAITALGLMVPPGQTRNLLYGIFAAAPPLGGLAGAFLAGLCATWDGLWSWTVLFGVLGIISAISCVILAIILPHEQPVDPRGKIDVVGACLGLSSLLLFNVAWGQAPAVGWSTPSEIAILTLSVLIFVLFLLWEHFIASEPIVPLNIFRAPTFFAMIFVVLFSYMAFGIALWYTISWQQILRQLSVLQIAINLIPFGLGSTAAVGLAVFLLPRVEAKLVMGIGVIVIIGASLLLATMPMHQTYWAQVFPAMLLCGCCPDFVYLAAQVIASNSVDRKHQGIASSLVGTLNLYGVSLGLGFAGTIEIEVGKKSLRLGGGESMEAIMSGFKAALYFSAALATIGLVLDFAFVKLPKVERHGWGEDMPLEAPDVAVRHTGSEANAVALG